MSRKPKSSATKKEAKVAGASSSSARKKREQDTPTTLVPKLRFPEFRKAEGWDAGALGTVADFVNEKIPVELVALENYVSTENILPDYGGVARATKLPTMGSVTKYKPNDTLVSNIRPYLKKVWVADKDGGASNDVIVIRAKQRLLPQYVSCLLKNDAFIDYVMTGAKGVKMPRGDIGSMKKYPTLYPFIPEQQKIATCLNTVDELIAAQARKLDALKTHKKGLMQQLFPREGETQPRLRFPEFKKAGEWVESTVDEIIATVTPPKKLQTADYQPEGEFPIIDQSQNAICGWTNDRDALTSEGLPVIVFGDHTCALKFIDYPFVQGADGIKIFRPKRGIDVRFLFCALEANPVVQETYKRHFSMLKEKKLSFPDPKTGEQQRIATCLTSLDDLIAAQTQKLEALKTHKKGLMQQLFPSPEEVEA
jgi:type I restriction enzyme S subunit